MANQVVKGVGEQLEKQVKDTGKALAQEPKKILESILGTSGKTDKGESGIETPVGGGGKKQTKQQPASDSLLVQKKIEEEKKKAVLLRHHREKMKEEEAFYAQEEQEEKKEEAQEMAEEQQKQAEIVQLKRQKEKEAVLQAESPATPKGPMGLLGLAVKKKKGTKELGKQIT